MAAPTIVTIRPGVAFTPEAAASWRRMETQVGRPIDCNSSYRDWDQQYRMWQAWEAWVTGKGPKPPHGRAIHPDRSMHCKGLAADTDDVALLLSLADHGWRRTAADEPWHFEYWQTFDRHYGRPPEEDDMFTDADRALLKHALAGKGGTQYYERVKPDGTSDKEWMHIDPSYGPLDTDPKQDGYRVTTDINQARIWGRQVSGAATRPVHLVRDLYIAQQDWARPRAREWRATLTAIVKAAIGDLSGGTVDVAAIAKAVNDDMSRRLAG